MLDPFAGSGTTAEACVLEDFGCIAVEKDEDDIPLIAERIKRSARYDHQREAMCELLELEDQQDLD